MGSSGVTDTPLSPADNAVIQVNGRYLYGASAAGNPAAMREAVAKTMNEALGKLEPLLAGQAQA